jgi:hypothetical protein
LRDGFFVQLKVCVQQKIERIKHNAVFILRDGFFVQLKVRVQQKIERIKK